LKEAEKIDKKGGPVIVKLLNDAKLDAKRKEMNIDLLYVHQAYVGGGYRSKKVEFKGRGT
jgi:ribosomal protein L22